MAEEFYHKPKWRDFLELMETVLTIVVSVAALWGAITAIGNGFFSKLKHVVDHYHLEALKDEACDLKKDIDKI